MSGQIEVTVRLGFFLGILLIMALWEVLAPRRVLTVRKAPRWASNLGLVVLNGLLARFLIPITAVGAAIVAESRSKTNRSIYTVGGIICSALRIAYARRHSRCSMFANRVGSTSVILVPKPTCTLFVIRANPNRFLDPHRKIGIDVSICLLAVVVRRVFTLNCSDVMATFPQRFARRAVR